MVEINFGQASNRADWAPEAVQLIDDETGEPIDLAGAAITIMVRDENGSQRLRGTLDDYVDLIEQDGASTIVQWTFPASAMHGLCTGTYRVGMIAERDGETEQVILGSLPVVEGVVR